MEQSGRQDGHVLGEEDTISTQIYDAHNRNIAWTYDPSGNLLSMNEPAPNELTFAAAQHTYDATSRHVQVTQTTSKPSPSNPNLIFTTTTTTSAAYDGDGQQVKRVKTMQTNSNQPGVDTTYYLRSSVLEPQTGVRLAILRFSLKGLASLLPKTIAPQTFSSRAKIVTSLLKAHHFKCRVAMQDSCGRSELTREELAARMRSPCPGKRAQKSKVVCIT